MSSPLSPLTHKLGANQGVVLRKVDMKRGPTLRWLAARQLRAPFAIRAARSVGTARFVRLAHTGLGPRWGSLRTIQLDIIPGGGIIQGLEVGEHRRAGEGVADVGFDAF
jgi:hypothetical protein